jgi:hypothetical protein
MTEKFKLFYKDEEYFLTKDEDVVVGDDAVVTVNDLYPTIVKCQNKEQINIIQNPLTKSTKRYKVVQRLDNKIFDDKTNKLLQQKEGAVIVEYNEGQIKILEDL